MKKNKWLASWLMWLLACSKPKEQPIQATAEPTVAKNATVATTPPEPKEPSEVERLVASKTLAEAINAIQPQFKDKENDLDFAAILFATWMQGKNVWMDIIKLKETTFVKVLKDSDSERGKKICASGVIAEITKTSKESMFFTGAVVTMDSKVIRYMAVNSTGDLVQGSSGKFCGVVTGKYSYSNAIGGTTHAVHVVGMFDLPENKKMEEAKQTK